MEKNKNRVPRSQWKKWSEHGRYVFNSLYEEMMGDQDAFLHPKAPPSPAAHWKTTSWNAAWIAADYATMAEKGSLL